MNFRCIALVSLRCIGGTDPVFSGLPKTDLRTGWYVTKSDKTLVLRHSSAACSQGQVCTETPEIVINRS